MNTYLYDGEYKSLLSLINVLIRDKIEPLNIKCEKEYIDSLFDEPIYLKLENDKELSELKKSIPINILKTCYYAFLSSEDNKELAIYKFIKDANIYKNGIYYRRNLDSVNNIINYSHKVSSELHRMKGFLRFKKMKNFYYAEMSPTNNIIWLLPRHFKERLKNELWIIKDNAREIYALYDTKKVTFLKKDDICKLDLHFSSDEVLFEELWKTFFKTIAIKERKNLKCQMNHLPKKYWKNMLEMEE